MATFDYVQTDTSATFNVGCSGLSGGITTLGRDCAEGGTAGTGTPTIDPDSGTSDAELAVLAFDCGVAPAVAEWASGDYVVPVNIITMDGGSQLVSCYVCDFDGTSTYVSVASQTGNASGRGTTGVHTFTCNRATAYTPQSESNSRVFIVISMQNSDAHGAAAATITPNQTITTPIVKPVGFAYEQLHKGPNTLLRM